MGDTIRHQTTQTCCTGQDKVVCGHSRLEGEEGFHIRTTRNLAHEVGGEGLLAPAALLGEPDEVVEKHSGLESDEEVNGRLLLTFRDVQAQLQHPPLLWVFV